MKLEIAFMNMDWKKAWLVRGSILGVLAFMMSICRLLTNEATLIVKVNEPGAQVQVVSKDGIVESARTGKNGQTSIVVDPGKYHLNVTKKGFAGAGRDFEIESGGTRRIVATLVPPAARTMAAPAEWHGWPAEAPPPAIAPFDATQAKAHQAAWANYLNVPLEYVNSIGMKFILIPPGEFMMGSTAAEIFKAGVSYGDDALFFRADWRQCTRSEAPQHKVILTRPIYLGVHEVTQKEYETVIGKNPSYYRPGGEGNRFVADIDTSDHPVEEVDWNDVANFCAKLNEREKLEPQYFRAGAGYRLPTEAQWEFACRGGTTTKYWAGDKHGDLPQAAWFRINAGPAPHAVGELKANPFGLYDVHGNVEEWVQDGWEPGYYAQFLEKSAIDPRCTDSVDSSGFILAVMRGGTRGDNASTCRSSARSFTARWWEGGTTGFRVALGLRDLRRRRR